MPLSPHTIVDAVYEAVAFPDRWPSVMDQVASFAGAAGGSVHLTDGASSMRRASERLEGLMASWFEEGWHRHTFWHQRAVNFRRQSFYDVLDLCSAEELERDPMFNRFFLPRGFGWSIGSVFHGLSGEVVRLNIQYRADYGPTGARELKRLNSLRRHLGRASLLTAKTQRVRPAIGLAALDLLDVAAAVLDRRGRLLACNHRFADVAPQVTTRSNDQIVFHDPGAQAAFETLLGWTAISGSRRLSGSIPVGPADGKPPALAQLVPACGDARDVFGADATIMVVNPVQIRKPPSAEMLKKLFRLTPAETRLASALVQGQSIPELARATGVSRDTLKSQLASIFAKTNTKRQAQLVALLTTGTGSRI